MHRDKKTWNLVITDRDKSQMTFSVDIVSISSHLMIIRQGFFMCCLWAQDDLRKVGNNLTAGVMGEAIP